MGLTDNVRVRRTPSSNGGLTSRASLSLSASSSSPSSSSSSSSLSATSIKFCSSRSKVSKLLMMTALSFSLISLSTEFSLLEPFRRHFFLDHSSDNVIVSNSSNSSRSNNLNSSPSNSILITADDEQNEPHAVVKRQARDKRGKVYQLASQEKLMLLQRHNYYRRLSAKDFLAAASGMYKLTWSEELVNQALEAISCTSSESQAARPRGSGLAFNQGKVENGELIDIISDWYDDGWRYTASSDTCFGNQRQACRDFITMMYEKTKEVGCAVLDCEERSKQVYCVYNPGLPDLSQRPFALGPACSSCPEADCDGGLCVSRKIVDENIEEVRETIPTRTTSAFRPTPPPPPITIPTRRPTTTDGEEGCSFTQVRNKDLVGHHNKWKVGSIKDCEGFCLSETDFKCKAFMYYEPYGSCALSAASHRDIDPADYRDRKGLDYYHVSCRGDNYIDRPVLPTRPTRDPYADRKTQPTRDPYADRRTTTTRDPNAERRTTPTRVSEADRRTRPTKDPYADRRTRPTRDPYEDRRARPTRDPYEDRQTRPTRDPYADRRTTSLSGPESAVTTECRFTRLPDRTISSPPSRKTDFLHWQDILTLDQCKEACKDGRPVGNCKAIAMEKSGIGCWLLPESSRDYHQRGELIQSKDFDLHDSVCESSRTRPETPQPPEGGAGTKPAPTQRPDVGEPQTSFAADFVRHRDKTLISSEFPSQPATGLHWRSRFVLEECLRECAENRVRDPAGCQAVAFDKRRAQGCWLLPQNYQYYDEKNALSRNPRFDFYDKKEVTTSRRRPVSEDKQVQGFQRKPNLGSYDAGGAWKARMSLEECGRACEESGTLDGKDCFAFQFNHARSEGCFLFTEDQYKRSAFTRSNEYDVYELQERPPPRRRPSRPDSSSSIRCSPSSPCFRSTSSRRRVRVGTDVIFHCEVTHKEEILISWRKDGVLLTYGSLTYSSNPRLRLQEEGERLLLRGAKAQDGGNYECVLSTRPPKHQSHVLHVERRGGTPGESGPPPFVSRCEFDRYQQMHIRKSAFPSRPAEGRHWRDDLYLDQCKRACEDGTVVPNCRLIAFNVLLQRGCWLLEHNYNYFKTRDSVQPNHHYELYDMNCDPTREIGPSVEAGTQTGTPKGDGGAPEEAEEEEEIVNGCGYKLYSNHAIFPFPSLAKDAIHWQQGMDVRECKRSCREGRPVAGCKSLVYYKKDTTQGCWLLPEDRSTYERRREYYEFSDYDFYQLQCENNQGADMKQGVCPSASDAGGSCDSECDVDTDCFGSRKCCSNGCGMTCVDPASPETRDEDDCKFTEHKNQWIWRPEHGGNQTGLTLEQCKMACKMNTFFDNCRGFVFKNPPNEKTGCYFMPNPVGFYGRLNQGRYVTTYDVDCKKGLLASIASPSSPFTETTPISGFFAPSSLASPSFPPGDLDAQMADGGEQELNESDPAWRRDDASADSAAAAAAVVPEADEGLGNSTTADPEFDQSENTTTDATVTEDEAETNASLSSSSSSPSPPSTDSPLSLQNTSYSSSSSSSEFTALAESTSTPIPEVSPKCSFMSHPRMAPKPDAFPSRMDEKVHWREGLNEEECKALCSHRHVVLNCRSVAMSKDPSKPGCWLLPNSFVQLEKMNKMAPNLFYEMLDMKCKVEDCTFTVRKNRALAGYNSKRIYANSPNDCKQMCIEEEEFECLSFEWWKNSKDCSLSSDSVDTVPQTLFQHNENSDYYHRSCGFDPAPTQPLDICAEAIETLGVNSGRVKDNQFSASSLEIPRKTAPHCARVINLNEECHGGYGWCPRVGDSDPWLQLDLGSPKKVIGVMLYSGGDANRRVPKFSVRTSEDGREWNFFLDGYGNKMEFKGFTDASIVGPVTITFPRHLFARQFRLYPLRGDDRQLENVCLRIELLTC